jgi:hypothetical protein
VLVNFSVLFATSVPSVLRFELILFARNPCFDAFKNQLFVILTRCVLSHPY